jgi:outer membrane protein
MRRLTRVKLALSLLAVFALVKGAGAAQPMRRRISLPEAIAIAMRHNRTLRAADLQGDAAQAQVGVARGAMLPRLDAIENYSETNNPVLVFSNLLAQQEFSQNDFALSRLNHPATLSNFQSQVRLSFPVFAGGRLLAGFRAARFGAQAEKWRAARARDETAFTVINAYYTAVLAEQRQRVIERALDAARSHLTQAGNLFSYGKAVKADVLRTEVAVGTLEEQQSDAESQVKIAWAALAHALGDEDESLAPIWNPGAPGAAAPLGAEPLDKLIADAAAQRLEIKIAAAQVKQADAAVTIARADYLPSVNLATTYENDSEQLTRGGNNFAVFAYAEVNLFNGLATKSKVDAAQAERARAKDLADDLKHAIALEVESAYRTLQAAEKNVAVADSNNRYAAEALRILADRYGAGLATNVDVLEAQAARQQADMGEVHAQVAVFVARAALDLSIGRSPAELSGQ